jgi:hypothetical protein
VAARVLRTAAILMVLPAAIGAAGCSSGAGGGSKGGASRKGGGCALVADLDDTAAAVARADVSDPVGFKATLDAAVTHYVRTARALRPLVPVDVQSSVDQVAADVQQYRFKDALADGAPLDAYAAHACRRGVTTTSSP